MSEDTLTALVEFEIREENATMDEWVATWGARAEDAWNGEPETLAYETAVSIENPKRVLVFERYQNGRSSVETHMKRPAHADLERAMIEKKMTRRRVLSATFSDIEGYGWWARPDRERAEHSRTRGGTILTMVGMRFPKSEARDVFLELTGEHARYCWKNEPGTLTYSGGLVHESAHDDADVEQGDFLFVMECTDPAAAEKHAQDPNHLAIGAKLAARGIEIQPTIAGTYRTTGTGFMSRPAA